MKIVIVTLAAALMMVLTSAISLAQNETAITGAGALERDIVEVATLDGDFDTLISALQSARLNETLSGPGPYTLFAPTDEAFAKIPQAQLNDLITNDSEKNNLRSILTYHVVPGMVLSSDFKDGLNLRTMEGSDLLVNIDNTSVMVNGARVVRPEINGSNGVIHAIDTVLIPPAVSATTNIIGANETTEGNVSGVVASAEEEAREAAGREEERPGQEETRTPGFGASLAALGILAVAYLSLGRRE